MSVIGNFTAKGNEFTGAITTLTIRATNVRISPVQRMADAGPSHRVFAGDAEVGAAWSRRSKEGRPYLSVRLDDPSLIAPVYASLLADENGRATTWSGRGASRAAASDRLGAPASWSAELKGSAGRSAALAGAVAGPRIATLIRISYTRPGVAASRRLAALESPLALRFADRGARRFPSERGRGTCIKTGDAEPGQRPRGQRTGAATHVMSSFEPGSPTCV